MSLSSIAKDLTAMCQAGKFTEAIAKHYSEKAVTIESVTGAAASSNRTKGLKAIQQRTASLAENYKVNKVTVSGPFLGNGQFTLHLQIDVSAKSTKQRMRVSEMALYTVSDGKIVQAEFYYTIPA